MRLFVRSLILVAIAATTGFAIWISAKAYNADNPDGFWHAFIPNFYANLGGVSLAAAVGIPIGLLINRLWANEQERRETNRFRVEARQVLSTLAREVERVGGLLIQIPTQVSAASTGQGPAGAARFKIETRVIEWASGDASVQRTVGQYLIVPLTLLRSELDKVNDLLDTWDMTASSVRPVAQRQSSLQQLEREIHGQCRAAQTVATLVREQVSGLTTDAEGGI